MKQESIKIPKKKRQERYQHFAQSDNTSAIAWLYSQISFKNKQLSTFKKGIGREIGNDLIEADASL